MKRKTFFKIHLEIYDIDIDFLFFNYDAERIENK